MAPNLLVVLTLLLFAKTAWNLLVWAHRSGILRIFFLVTCIFLMVFF